MSYQFDQNSPLKLALSSWPETLSDATRRDGLVTWYSIIIDIGVRFNLMIYFYLKLHNLTLIFCILGNYYDLHRKFWGLDEAFLHGGAALILRPISWLRCLPEPDLFLLGKKGELGEMLKMGWNNINMRVHWNKLRSNCCRVEITIPFFEGFPETEKPQNSALQGSQVFTARKQADESEEKDTHTHMAPRGKPSGVGDDGIPLGFSKI